MTHGDLFLREKHDRISGLWTFIGKELARMETNVLDWLEVTAAACPDNGVQAAQGRAYRAADMLRETFRSSRPFRIHPEKR